MLGILKAMRTTLGHLPQRKITVQYPEQREQLPERSRGLFRVVIDPATDDPRCRSCTLCETNCPVQVIRVNYESRYELPVVNEARIERVRADSQPTPDLKLIRPVIDHYRETGTGMMAVLQHTQEIYGYLPRLALREISVETGVSLSQLYGVASFYDQFRLSPVGRFVITVCHGTACHVAGAPLITDAFSEELGVAVGKTTKDRLFTLQTAGCLGALRPRSGRAGRRRRDPRPHDPRRRRAPWWPSSGTGPRSTDERDHRRSRERHSRRPRSGRCTPTRSSPARAPARCASAPAPPATPSGRPAVTAAFRDQLAEQGLVRHGAGRRNGLSRLLRAGPHRRRAAPGAVLLAGAARPTSAGIIAASIVADGVYDKRLYKRPCERRARFPTSATSPSTPASAAWCSALHGKIDPHSIDDYLAQGGYARAGPRPRRRRSGRPDQDGRPSPDCAATAAPAPSPARRGTSTRRRPGDVKYVVCSATRATPGPSSIAPSSRATRTS